MSKKAEIIEIMKKRERVAEIKGQIGFHRIILQVDQEGVAIEIEKLFEVQIEALREIANKPILPSGVSEVAAEYMKMRTIAEKAIEE